MNPHSKQHNAVKYTVPFILCLFGSPSHSFFLNLYVKATVTLSELHNKSMTVNFLRALTPR